MPELYAYTVGIGTPYEIPSLSWTQIRWEARRRTTFELPATQH